MHSEDSFETPLTPVDKPAKTKKHDRTRTLSFADDLPCNSKSSDSARMRLMSRNSAMSVLSAASMISNASSVMLNHNRLRQLRKHRSRQRLLATIPAATDQFSPAIKRPPKPMTLIRPSSHKRKSNRNVVKKQPGIIQQMFKVSNRRNTVSNTKDSHPISRNRSYTYDLSGRGYRNFCLGLLGPRKMDEEMFESASRMAKQEIEETNADSLLNEGKENDSPAKYSGFYPRVIRIGRNEIVPWYKSPFPVEFRNQSRLYFCEQCLNCYTNELVSHKRKCSLIFPPGDEIYRDDVNQMSIFEIDGARAQVYCRNLCLMFKLFIEHKTLYFNVEFFMFYVLTKNDDDGCHIIGYFSKEKFGINYNLSCIVVLPCYQTHGYGRFLIDFSYLISRRESATGTPERPLSKLGYKSYSRYWKAAIYEYLYIANLSDPGRSFSLEDISAGTGMALFDTVHTLKVAGMLRVIDEEPALVVDWRVLFRHWINEKNNERRIWLDEGRLRWTAKLPSVERGMRSATSSPAMATDGSHSDDADDRNRNHEFYATLALKHPSGKGKSITSNVLEMESVEEMLPNDTAIEINTTIPDGGLVFEEITGCQDSAKMIENENNDQHTSFEDNTCGNVADNEHDDADENMNASINLYDNKANENNTADSNLREIVKQLFNQSSLSEPTPEEIIDPSKIHYSFEEFLLSRGPTPENCRDVTPVNLSPCEDAGDVEKKEGNMRKRKYTKSLKSVKRSRGPAAALKNSVSTPTLPRARTAQKRTVNPNENKLRLRSGRVLGENSDGKQNDTLKVPRILRTQSKEETPRISRMTSKEEPQRISRMNSKEETQGPEAKIRRVNSKDETQSLQVKPANRSRSASKVTLRARWAARRKFNETMKTQSIDRHHPPTVSRRRYSFAKVMQKSRSVDCTEKDGPKEKEGEKGPRYNFRRITEARCKMMRRSKTEQSSEEEEKQDSVPRSESSIASTIRENEKASCELPRIPMMSRRKFMEKFLESDFMHSSVEDDRVVPLTSPAGEYQSATNVTSSEDDSSSDSDSSDSSSASSSGSGSSDSGSSKSGSDDSSTVASNEIGQCNLVEWKHSRAKRDKSPTSIRLIDTQNDEQFPSTSKILEPNNNESSFDPKSPTYLATMEKEIIEMILEERRATMESAERLRMAMRKREETIKRLAQQIGLEPVCPVNGPMATNTQIMIPETRPVPKEQKQLMLSRRETTPYFNGLQSVNQAISGLATNLTSYHQQTQLSTIRQLTLQNTGHFQQQQQLFQTQFHTFQPFFNVPILQPAANTYTIPSEVVPLLGAFLRGEIGQQSAAGSSNLEQITLPNPQQSTFSTRAHLLRIESKLSVSNQTRLLQPLASTSSILSSIPPVISSAQNYSVALRMSTSMSSTQSASSSRGRTDSETPNSSGDMQEEHTPNSSGVSAEFMQEE